MILLFFKAFLIGLSIAMPIGPIATFLIKNSLERGFKAGLAVGFGAALVEGIYSFVAASGFVLVAKFLNNHLTEIKLFCGILLILLGIFEVKNAAKISTAEIKMKRHGFFRTAFLVMLITFANPITIVFFAGVFATISGNNFGALDIAIISCGAFCGSLSWTASLSFVISKIRHKISQKKIIQIRLISGLIIAGFGVYGISSLI
jgi:putative LysE/RhtB family amino acid efflux pump